MAGYDQMIGIRYNPRPRKWIASIKGRHIGSFSTEAEAIAAQAAYDPLGESHVKREPKRPFGSSFFSITASNSVFTMAEEKRKRMSR